MPTTNKFPTPKPRKIHVGAFQPTLEAALAAEIADFKKQNGPLAPLTVIVPTHLLGLYLRRKLAPHANIRFPTLDEFLPAPPPRLGLELLCRQLAKSCDKYFAPVNDTTGFATALLETFKDLEQAGITSFTGKTQKLRELADAYESYRKFLPSSVPSLPSSVFLYGFYDLTAVQRHLVAQLTPEVIFFPSPSEFSRPLLEWFGGLASTIPRRHVSTILSCPGEAAEVREAFRQALQFVEATGKTFNDVAILCRSREQYDAIIRDAAGHFEVPVFFRGGRPLSEHREARRLALLLEVFASDFARGPVLELAGRPDWELLSLEHGIVGGREQWRRVPEIFAWLEPWLRIKLPARGPWNAFIQPMLQALGPTHPPVAETIRGLAELEAFQKEVTLPEFSAICQRALEQVGEPTLPFQGGGIFVSDVMGARGLQFSLVIVLGMAEKSFPRIIREDPLLLDAERRQLSADLPLKQRGHEEERLLFDLTLGVASEKIVLTYSRIDTGSARPRLASSLSRQFDVEHVRVPLLAREGAMTGREYDLALLKPGKLPVKLLEEISPNLARGLEAERNRWGLERITEYDGLVPAAGTKDLPVAPTQLETFAFCPFKYFAKQILGLERWDDPEHIWSADPGEIGSVVHDILEDFYKQAALPLQPKLREVYRKQLIKITNDRLDVFARTGVTGLPVVWSLRQTALRRDLLRFLDLEIERAGDFVPWKFEEEFGPVLLEKLGVSVKGRIDRIDRNDAGMRIVDYKTGKAYHKKTDALDGGEALQLPLYAMAAAQVWGMPVESSAYAYLTLAGGYQYVEMTGAGVKARQEDLRNILKTFGAMLRDGEFFQETGHGKCAWCDYRPICGSGISRLGERKANDPRFAPFHAIKEIK